MNNSVLLLLECQRTENGLHYIRGGACTRETLGIFANQVTPACVQIVFSSSKTRTVHITMLVKTQRGSKSTESMCLLRFQSMFHAQIFS